MNILEKVKVKVSVFGHAKCNNIGFCFQMASFYKRNLSPILGKKNSFRFHSYYIKRKNKTIKNLKLNIFHIYFTKILKIQKKKLTCKGNSITLFRFSFKSRKMLGVQQKILYIKQLNKQKIRMKKERRSINNMQKYIHIFLTFLLYFLSL